MNRELGASISTIRCPSSRCAARNALLVDLSHALLNGTAKPTKDRHNIPLLLTSTNVLTASTDGEDTTCGHWRIQWKDIGYLLLHTRRVDAKPVTTTNEE